MAKTFKDGVSSHSGQPAPVLNHLPLQGIFSVCPFGISLAATYSHFVFLLHLWEESGSISYEMPLYVVEDCS